MSPLYIFKDTPLDRTRALINIILSGIVYFILLLRIYSETSFSSFLFIPLAAFILSIQILNFNLFRLKVISGRKQSSRRRGFEIYRIVDYTSNIYLVEWILLILSYLSITYLILDSLGFGVGYSGVYVVLAIIGVLLFVPVIDMIITKTR